MEKSQPPPYEGVPSALEPDYPPTEHPPPQTGYSQHAYPPQRSYPPQYPGYPEESGYPPQSGCPPQSGYTEKPRNEPQPVSPPAPVSDSPQVVYVREKSGYFSELQRNNPQLKSLYAATLIFMSGGMSLAWSVGFTSNEYNGILEAGAAKHMQVCWFVAVIIGACIATILIEKLTKRVLNLLASVLVIANGILFVSAPHTAAVILVARYCDGIAFGLTVIPAIIAGSEISVKWCRGLVLSAEQFGLVIGIAFQINISHYTGKLDSNQMHGILAIIYGVLAFIFSLVASIESPIFYLRKNNEAEAINVLRQLQSSQVVTTETYALLCENKRLLQEDDARGSAINAATGLTLLLRMCLLRAYVTMSIAVPFTVMLSLSATLSDNDSWGLPTYGMIRLIGTVIAVSTLDSVGRKGLTGLSILIGGGLLIGVGSVFEDTLEQSNLEQMGLVLKLLIAYQACIGLAAPASTCYMGEAFSVSVKPYFILVIVVIENIIQIIICNTFKSGISRYTYTLGALQILYAIRFFFYMPETKQTTLREALAKFNKTENLCKKNRA